MSPRYEGVPCRPNVPAGSVSLAQQFSSVLPHLASTQALPRHVPSARQPLPSGAAPQAVPRGFSFLPVSPSQTSSVQSFPSSAGSAVGSNSTTFPPKPSQTARLQSPLSGAPGGSPRGSGTSAQCP